MHGLGNDFIVLDFTKQTYPLSASIAVQLANRKTGIGCDQILMVETSDQPGIDFKYRILNADGGEVNQCGNGARCFAVFVREQGLTDKTLIRVETKSGAITLNVNPADNCVAVDMGVPEFAPDKIPILTSTQAAFYTLEVAHETIEYAALSIGNPHAVITVGNIDDCAFERLGPALESHRAFPERVNVGFMQVINDQSIKLRVYERGVGETMACGSGACAAVIAGIQQGLLKTSVTVHLTGGELEIFWDGDGSSVIMTGPATSVYRGEIELDNL
jgi:diaminopimelate epimerase